ncbi:chorismate mutase [candidate division KSB1 bacterium]|nr:chorismate mutase [candidate division KSB1 bacterium]RQW03807.1 MAG: chorismate mutase [candidate division KSB1 bacterium]
MNLSDCRQAIDDIDDQLLEILNQRARLAIKIAQEKFDHRIAVAASSREEEIYKRLCGRNKGPLQEQHVREIFAAIFSTSKKLQHLYQSFQDV